MILLLNYWFHVPTSVLSPILDGFSYAAGFKYLGKAFLPRSIAATFSLAFFLRFWEVMPFRLPDLSDHPLLAAVFGACFVGVGVGLIVRQGIPAAGTTPSPSSSRSSLTARFPEPIWPRT